MHIDHTDLAQQRTLALTPRRHPEVLGPLGREQQLGEQRAEVRLKGGGLTTDMMREVGIGKEGKVAA